MKIYNKEMLKNKLKTCLKIITDVNKNWTRSQIVYTALLTSLLLNLLIFVVLNASDSHRDRPQKYDTASNRHIDFKVQPHKPHKIEFESLRLVNVDRKFKSLDERLQKYNLQQDLRLNIENGMQTEHAKTTTTTYENIISTKRNILKIKNDSRTMNIKEAQRLADERNRRSEHYLRQIMGRDRSNNVNINNLNYIRNEDVRSKYVVVSDSVNRPDIWLHRVKKTTNSTTFYEHHDAILDQINYIPESYKRKLNKLNLVDRYSKHFNENRYVILNDYLKKEFASVYDVSVQNEWKHIPLKNNIIKKEQIMFNKSFLKTNKQVNTFKSLSSPDWSTLLKVIYLPDGLSEDLSYGRNTFISEECLVSSCYLTSNPAFELTAHLRVERMYAMKTTKPTGQIWMSWFLESPVNSVYIPQNTYKDRINWTASFRTDSIIVTPYAKYVQHSEPQSKLNLKNYAKGKTRFAAWFVSSCGSTNNRFGFVKVLQRFMPVDIFGACGFLECDINDKEKCFSLLSTRYKFYLSFENSNCDYYITEKLFLNALQNNVVPVVMGARKEDYLKAAPPHSFIHVEDFKNERELAEYLKLLNKNDELYNKYFEWKGNGDFVNTKFWCRLCSLLQDHDKPHIWYSDFEEWWMSKATCRRSRWTR